MATEQVSERMKIPARYIDPENKPKSRGGELDKIKRTKIDAGERVFQAFMALTGPDVTHEIQDQLEK